MNSSAKFVTGPDINMHKEFENRIRSKSVWKMSESKKEAPPLGRGFGL